MVEINITHRQNQLPMGLATSQFLGSMEVEKVLVVSENDDSVWVAFQVMTPFHKSVNISE
jgi:hypothetical protein